jgi:hypothetical protein
METLLANKLIAYGTVIMAIATTASFIALVVNAFLFQRQIKAQREQTNTMLDLRRKSIAPSLFFFVDKSELENSVLISLQMINKGDTATSVVLKSLKKDGLIGIEELEFNPIKNPDSGRIMNWDIKLEKEYDVELGIYYFDLDGNLYDTILGFKTDDKSFRTIQLQKYIKR